MPNILEHNKDLTTAEMTMKMPGKLQEVPITAKGSVQQMWDTIKDRVIGSGSQTIPMTKSC